MKSECERNQLRRFSDLFSIIGGGTPKTSVPEYWNGDIPWLSVKDFCGDRKFVYSAEKSITQLGLDNSSTKLLQAGDIIVSARGTVGELAMVGKTMAFNQSCFGLRAKEGIDEHYLYYLTQTKINELKKLSHGSVFDTITRETFEKVTCHVPPLPVQRKIASILSALDDKIEANNAICRNLEEQMQIMYDYLFVSNSGDMRQIGTISDLGQVMGGGTPSKKESAYYTQRGIPWITPKDLSRNSAKFITQGEIDITPEGLAASSATLMPTGTVLFSSRAPVGYIAIADAEVTTNQGFKSVIPKETIGTAYLYYFLKTNKKVIEMRASGSTFPEVSASIMRQIPAIVPGRRSLNIFNAFCKPRFELQRKLEAEILNIAQLRDALLLNLLSGDMNIQN